MALLHQVFLAGTVNKFELKHKKKKFNVFFPRIVEKGEQVLWEPPLLPCRCVQPKLKEEKLFTPPPPTCPELHHTLTTWKLTQCIHWHQLAD